jgi:alpha-D-ribose 1-methylphosphonate 5-triphosphate synthase subunit PhnL
VKIPVLTVRNLHKSFLLHDQGQQIPSCSAVNLSVHAGELTALVGPTGAGKSSVLKCIYRTYLPVSGEIVYNSRDGQSIDLVSASEHDILQLRHQEIGFVTQFLHCLPRRAALDLVAEALIIRGESQQSARQQAAELLALLNVPERLWQVPPATFSGGEKQRVNLARGLISRPRLLLLDEPTASLDPLTTQRVVELLRRIKQQGVAMLAIFHDPSLVAALADQTITLAAASLQTEITAEVC